MSCYGDGEFQINYMTNGFMGRLQGYSVNDMDKLVEFSTIDFTAKAIICFAGANDKFTVFHAYNSHDVHMANMIRAMNKEGIKIYGVKKICFIFSSLTAGVLHSFSLSYL